MAEKTVETNAKAKGGMDLITVMGLVVAMGGILGGLLLEGGKLKDVAQFTAGLIVLGGTAGAVLVSVPRKTLFGGLKRLRAVFFDPVSDNEHLIEEIIRLATKARKNGLVSLELDATKIEDPFLRKALNLAVDGTDLQEIRKMLELEIGLEEHQAEAEAKVFEYAGGFAPTVGIIGAVMGLIQVMKNLANIDEVGHGIAVSFVATVYGVGIANLFFLPAANKIKARAHVDAMRKEMIVEGISGLVEGMNPKLIRMKLDSYLPGAAPKPEKNEKAPRAAESPVRAEA